MGSLTNAEAGRRIYKLHRSYGLNMNRFENKNAMKSFICRFYKITLGIELNNRKNWVFYYRAIATNYLDYQLYLTGFIKKTK